MSKFYKEPIHTKPASKRDNRIEAQGYEHPFKIFPHSVETPLSVKISTKSNVLNSPSLDDKIPVLGLGSPITIVYGSKIWLEIFYDKNRVPLVGIIRSGRKWTATIKNISNQNETLNVYPDELEFISKYDVSDKINVIQDTIDYLITLKDLATAEFDKLKYFGVFNNNEYEAYINKLNDDHETSTNLLTELKNNLNNFFSAAPTSTWRKLFRTYLPLAYTTKDMSLGPDGITFNILNSLNQSDPNIPQATRPESFRLISIWNADVLLTDFCYQNRLPAKLHMPFHRGIGFYSINGDNEESKNTL